MSTEDLKGLKGWLILVGIGVVLSPIRMLVAYGPLYSGIFSDGTWEALTDPASEVYIRFFDVLLLTELAANGIVFALSVYAIWLYFSKSYLFPKIYIAILAGSLAFMLVDEWAVSLVIPETPMFSDRAAFVDFARSLIGSLIWIPYLLVSKRVKATFVEGRASGYQEAEPNTRDP